MMNGQANVSDARETDASALPIEVLRQRVTARSRLERPSAEDWKVVHARRQKVRMFAVCAGALLLMGLGLYLELSLEDRPPPSGSMAPAFAVRTTMA